MQNEDRQYVALSANTSSILSTPPSTDQRCMEGDYPYIPDGTEIELRVEQTGLYKRRVIRARLRLAGSILMDKYRHL